MLNINVIIKPQYQTQMALVGTVGVLAYVSFGRQTFSQITGQAPKAGQAGKLKVAAVWCVMLPGPGG